MRFNLLAMFLFLASCSSGPGAPPEVQASSKDQLVIPGCRNVRPLARSTAFNPNNYLTTWGSALGEGAAVGVREGVGPHPYGAGVLIAAAIPTSVTFGGDELIPRRGVAEEFCILVDAPESRVKTAQRAAFRELAQVGYAVVTTNSHLGILGTRFKKSGHRSANWYDKFSSSTYPIDGSTTAVFVLREVFISRSNDPFVQGRSVGANETAVLTRIRDLALATGG